MKLRSPLTGGYQPSHYIKIIEKQELELSQLKIELEGQLLRSKQLQKTIDKLERKLEHESKGTCTTSNSVR
jgi:hypothetical protein